MPLNKALYRAVSKWCISDQSIEFIAKAYIHHFETAIRFNYVRPALARCYMNIIMTRKDYSIRALNPIPANQVWARGITKKDMYIPNNKLRNQKVMLHYDVTLMGRIRHLASL